MEHKTDEWGVDDMVAVASKETGNFWSEKVMTPGRKAWLRKYADSLKFTFHLITHPIDGYWDLTHEHRGTMAAANTILILTLVARIFKLRYTSFVVQQTQWQRVNIFLYLASVLFPLALWVVGNWALTTLFDGKGRLGQVYMYTCYALAPYPLIQIPLTLISNLVTTDEASFIGVFSVISLVWAAGLIILGEMQIHEFKIGKTILFTVFTLFAMFVMIFILLLFFSMISQGVAYFISIGKELMFRM